jgi:type II secretory pathway component GspD/PulD (secretin)
VWLNITNWRKIKMKNVVTILLAILTAGLAAAQDDKTIVNTNTAFPDKTDPSLADLDMPKETFPTNGIVLNFQNVPLVVALDFLSAKAGWIIISDAVLRGSVSIVTKQPVGTNEIVDLLNEQLSRNNLTAILEGRTLQIMDSERAKLSAFTPVRSARGPADVANTDAMVTEILPVRILKPAQLVKDLEPLIPHGATVTANEAGSAIIMTAPGRDVRRISEIIAALDSSAISEVEVFVLKFADAKSVAAELKEIFHGGDSDTTRAGTRNNFGPFGARGGGGAVSDDTAKNAQTLTVFVSDDQMNAVVASAPPDYMRTVHKVIAELDQPSQDITEIKCFALKHADPSEVADELSALFESNATASDQNSRTMGFRFNPFQQQPSGESAKSTRMKRQSTVLAVADRRTESVFVSASRDSMAEIKSVIASMDEGNRGMTHVTAIRLESADPAAVQLTLASLFLNPSSASSTATTALNARLLANINSQSSSTSSATSGFTSGGSGASAGH